MNIFSLLKWNYRLIDTLYGRNDDLSNILNWARGGSNIPTARLITGAGGTGKSRLAATAAQILRNDGWTAGFLDSSEDLTLNNIGPKGLFLILDYPDEQHRRTTALLAKLAELEQAAFPFRLVLLSRRSFAEWEREAAVLGGRFGRQQVATLGPLSLADGVSLIAETTERLCKLLGTPVPSIDWAPAWLDASPVNRIPLYAMAAAIHAGVSHGTPFDLSGAEVLRQLAIREIRRVRKTSQDLALGEQGIERALALAVLSNGLSEQTVRELTDAKVFLDSSIGSNVVDALAMSPWWNGGRLIRLTPDTLAAAFLDIALFSEAFPRGRDALSEWLFIALRENAAEFASRLARLMFDLHLVSERSRGYSALSDRLVEMLGSSSDRARLFADSISRNNRIWGADFLLAVSELLAKDQTVDVARRLPYIGNVAALLHGQRKYDKALIAGQECVNLYRDLVRANPQKYDKYLALSLSNLSNMLSALDKNEDSLAAAGEAVEIQLSLKSLEKSDRRNLAWSLDILVGKLFKSGKIDDALRNSVAALDIWQSLSQYDPDEYRDDFGESLRANATILDSMGRFKEAVQQAQRTSDIFRDLFQNAPEIYLSKFIDALETLCSINFKLENFKTGKLINDEIVEICVTAGNNLPHVLQAEFCKSLYRAALTLNTNRYISNAVEIMRLALGQYEKMDSDVRNIVGISNPAIILSKWEIELKKRQDKRNSIEEVVGYYGRLAEYNFEAFSPHLARALSMLADALEALGNYDEEKSVAEKAESLYRSFYKSRGAKYKKGFINALLQCSTGLLRLGMKREALLSELESRQLCGCQRCAERATEIARLTATITTE